MDIALWTQAWLCCWHRALRRAIRLKAKALDNTFFYKQDPKLKFKKLRSAQGASMELKVRQDSGQLHFSSAPPQRRPRHAFLPRWHFDMVSLGPVSIFRASRVS